MCRIFGFCGESSPQTTALLRALILTEETKNPDGTGLLIRNTQGLNTIQKKGLRGRDFIVQGYADFLWAKKYRYALGHVRFKTKGKQTDSNAHPFGFQVNKKWMFGIHNGIIGKPGEIAERYKLKEEDVDSATFFKAMAVLKRRGKPSTVAIEEMTEFISDKADFAFALLDEEKMWLWRSPDRPLCIFDARDVGMGRWFASTKEMFSQAWQMAGIAEDLRKVTYFEARPYRLYYAMSDGICEVEALKDLKHRDRKSPKESYRYFPTQVREKSSLPLFDAPDPFDYEDEFDGGMLEVRKLTDAELVLKIARVKAELEALKEESNPLVTEWRHWLWKLEAEEGRRKGLKTEKERGLYIGRNEYLRRQGLF